MPPALVNAADAAYWAGRSVGTIWRWASEGRISRYGSGKSVRYNVREIPKAIRDEETRALIEPGETPPLPEGARAA
ncbi:MerR family transcriptional regulator [Streptomyces wuyuanensis]|uniref:Helix-turn-helix domain-containing protein n=1 Tax=Streptomyces wuyuanensis TaxID=1196353 RepID=A0A1G9ZAI3_9ACTN|nr:helix-turn-helix domain-containing protein [Streptomyces wuyuanensis]SDN18095.1 hypothetical protein SAMN05444921_12139 [Streptomyces wuyuanensis]